MRYWLKPNKSSSALSSLSSETANCSSIQLFFLLNSFLPSSTEYSALLFSPVRLAALAVEHGNIGVDQGGVPGGEKLRGGALCVLVAKQGRALVEFGIRPRHKGMSAVEDSIDDHDKNHDDDDDDHVTRVLIRGELGGDISLIALHVRVKDEDVDDQNYLNRRHIHVQINTWLLLLYLGEESSHERVVPDEVPGQFCQIDATASFATIFVHDIVL
eukprot:CAMPEP_0185607386 /NCGR_PEP_ID=MMETSP0436-20130131/5476_1 /TAXON_ID=626734 ORGANISM="Favella taraikaensis, Strain Fe Narragansett Bay" /NCGR_SAMPLE_ID=MMETSP0436 /ASSEMBLY_ACC=CAM_ASM_000390 /LENGTH=214 /DNA_ID=CAMNT_0028239297 /DNA_START=1656 /DNA_END=2299 /DNA_ORIENTATION=-